MKVANVKSVYHTVDVEAYNMGEAFKNAIDKIKSSKALYQGGVFRDKPESVKRLKTGKKPKVSFEKMETVAVKRFEIHTKTAGMNGITNISDAKKSAMKLCLEKKETVRIELHPKGSLAYKVNFVEGTIGKFTVSLVEDEVLIRD